MLSREAILDVGYLDDNFSPGCGEDDDWLFRAHQLGWRLAIQTDALVHHVGQASWDLNLRAKCQERAVAYLKQKHKIALDRIPVTGVFSPSAVQTAANPQPGEPRTADDRVVPALAE